MWQSRAFTIPFPPRHSGAVFIHARGSCVLQVGTQPHLYGLWLASYLLPGQTWELFGLKLALETSQSIILRNV